MHLLGAGAEETGSGSRRCTVVVCLRWRAKCFPLCTPLSHRNVWHLITGAKHVLSGAQHVLSAYIAVRSISALRRHTATGPLRQVHLSRVNLMRVLLLWQFCCLFLWWCETCIHDMTARLRTRPHMQHRYRYSMHDLTYMVARPCIALGCPLCTLRRAPALRCRGFLMSMQATADVCTPVQQLAQPSRMQYVSSVKHRSAHHRSSRG